MVTEVLKTLKTKTISCYLVLWCNWWSVSSEGLNRERERENEATKITIFGLNINERICYRDNELKICLRVGFVVP